MLWRRMRAADLEACLALEPRHLGAELVGAEAARGAWRWMMRSSAFNSGIILAEPTAAQGIFGFGAGFFASPEFVDAELALPRPGVNARVVASIVEGNPVLLNQEELRRRNTHGGLDVVCLAGVYRQDVSEDFAMQILTALAASFVEAHAGYLIRQIIVESIGQVEIASVCASGIWRRVADFDERALFVMTRKEAYSNPISNTIQLFDRSEPLLSLREPDQQLLRAALNGLTDDELASCLNVHVGTVKKRWLEIYRHISEVAPALLLADHHEGDEVTRGKQKRHHILAYLRQHPEELRPYEITPAAAPR